MLIEGLINLIYAVLSVLTLPIKIPSMPDQVAEILAKFIDYITTGIALLSNYVHIQYLLALFALIFSIDVAIALYKFIMWVLKKIPILNIK